MGQPGPELLVEDLAGPRQLDHSLFQVELLPLEDSKGAGNVTQNTKQVINTLFPLNQGGNISSLSITLWML